MSVTTYQFKEIGAEDYDQDVLTEKQKLRQLIAMGYDVDDPDIDVTVVDDLRKK